MALQPCYWYSDYWMHMIYVQGLERSLRNIRDQPPIDHDGDLRKRMLNRDMTYFYWRILPGSGNSTNTGYQLLVATEKTNMQPFVPTVEARPESEGGTLRLYASKDYETGDAIVFISEYEEKSGSFVLGGVHARMATDLDKSNAYLTSHRALRCLRNISRGEEIVRWDNKESAKLNYFEKIDQVVLQPHNMVLGRFGRQSLSADGSKMMVHFADGMIEGEAFDHVKMFRSYE